ncbi:MAG: hypothetical protein CL763_01070 [Chloroflexi bacterium]|nr:hypothetical protein [Chloroflexota bacterium]
MLIAITVIGLIAYTAVAFVSCCITGATRWSNETMLILGLSPLRAIGICSGIIIVGTIFIRILKKNTKLTK